MSLTDYRTLGRSGLAVSPLALGTMTFGVARWGMERPDAELVFDAYVEAGGNLVDTADVYASGRGEEMLGAIIAERGLRDSLVLATKCGFAAGRGPHAGGNGAKHIHTALEGSLRRLRTEAIDLYWVHVWDSVTPAEELLETMSSLVRAGKIRYWGISNAPPGMLRSSRRWPGLRGLPGPVALQYFYSLVSREVEAEHLPLARDMGLSMMPWSPLAYGLLTGKYDARPWKRVHRVQAACRARLGTARRVPKATTGWTVRTPSATHCLRSATGDRRRLAPRGRGDRRASCPRGAGMGALPARRDTALMGVSRVSQLHDNIAALDLHLPAEQIAALDAASAPENAMIYGLFTPTARQHIVFGGQYGRRVPVTGM